MFQWIPPQTAEFEGCNFERKYEKHPGIVVLKRVMRCLVKISYRADIQLKINEIEHTICYGTIQIF